jgi:hypothetical protein
MFMLSERNPIRDLVLILLIVAILVAPMVLFGYHQGHDLNIHIESWMDAESQFHQGIFCPRWATEANYGFGEPRFIFYPPVSWMLGALIGHLFLWKIAPAVYVWICLVLAALTMRIFAADWLPPRQAIVAALLYALNPYMLVTAYTRCAYAELLASAVFPLLLWGGLQIARSPRVAFATTALALAAIWLTNLPAGVIASYSLACVLIGLSILHRSIRPMLHGGVAALTSMGLAAFSLLPAAWERKWVNIDAVLNPNHRPEANFLFASNSMRIMYLFSRRLSPLAVFLIVAAITALIFARKLRSQAPEAWWPLTVLCLFSSFLMFRVSSPLWRILPNLRFVQFPWRWLFPLCAVAILMITSAVTGSKRERILWTAVALVLAAIDAGIVYAKQWYPNATADIAAEIQSGRGYPGLAEYTPIGSQVLSLPKDAPLVAVEGSLATESAQTERAVYVEVWSAERKTLTANLSHPQSVKLKLLAYPAWQASVNGRPAVLKGDPQSGQLLLSLPAGPSLTEVRFIRTWDRTAGIAISISAAALLTGLQLLLYRRNRYVLRVN